VVTDHEAVAPASPLGTRRLGVNDGRIKVRGYDNVSGYRDNCGRCSISSGKELTPIASRVAVRRLRQDPPEWI